MSIASLDWAALHFNLDIVNLDDDEDPAVALVIPIDAMADDILAAAPTSTTAGPMSAMLPATGYLYEAFFPNGKQSTGQTITKGPPLESLPVMCRVAIGWLISLALI